MGKKQLKTIIFLQLLLMIYSLGGIFGKMASKHQFLSLRFCIFYGMIILLMFVYALGWQQIIRILPLSAAYANKAVIIVWGVIWGVLFFDEKINIPKIAGILMIISGVILFSTGEKEKHK